MRDGEVLLGPGMVELLEAIRRTGSLRVAAGELGMSYMHAWGLVKTMNRGFRDPLVELSRGGAAAAARGSARGAGGARPLPGDGGRGPARRGDALAAPEAPPLLTSNGPTASRATNAKPIYSTG